MAGSGGQAKGLGLSDCTSTSSRLRSTFIPVSLSLSLKVSHWEQRISFFAIYLYSAGKAAVASFSYLL
jgi:hypothetical protein